MNYEVTTKDLYDSYFLWIEVTMVKCYRPLWIPHRGYK